MAQPTELKTCRADSLKVGDYFVDRLHWRVWKVVGWLKDKPGDCPSAELQLAEPGIATELVKLETRAQAFFAGCATPYGPFETLEAAQEARAMLLDGRARHVTPHEQEMSR